MTKVLFASKQTLNERHGSHVSACTAHGAQAPCMLESSVCGPPTRSVLPARAPVDLLPILSHSCLAVAAFIRPTRLTDGTTPSLHGSLIVKNISPPAAASCSRMTACDCPRQRSPSARGTTCARAGRTSLVGGPGSSGRASVACADAAVAEPAMRR